MNILLTGSEGFIGKHLKTYLSDYSVTCCDLKKGQDVYDISASQLNDIDIVIHLAASTSVWNENYEEIVHNNITAFTNLFFLCKSLNKKFIYASSSCSANITSLYGISKKYDDLLQQTYSYGVGIRFHNVYGRNSRSDTLMGICQTNDTITLYNNGQNYRHFTYVDDICRAIVESFNLEDGIYNAYNPECTSTLQFCSEVARYKKLAIVQSASRRKLDKDQQIIQSEYKNLLEERYTSFKDGIRKTFEI